MHHFSYIYTSTLVLKITPEGIHLLVSVILDMDAELTDALPLICMDVLSKASMRLRVFSCIALGIIWENDFLRRSCCKEFLLSVARLLKVALPEYRGALTMLVTEPFIEGQRCCG